MTATTSTTTIQHASAIENTMGFMPGRVVAEPCALLSASDIFGGINLPALNDSKRIESGLTQQDRSYRSEQQHRWFDAGHNTKGAGPM